MRFVIDGTTLAELEAEERGRTAERAACAELVRAAGCACSDLNPFTAGSGQPFACWEDGKVEQHDHRCPIALAAAIEGRK